MHLKYLISFQILTISKPDKGLELVPINNADYIDKMKSILNDPTKTKKLNNVKNISMNAEKYLIVLLKELINKQILQTYTTKLNTLD